MTRAREFIERAETQAANAAADQRMFDTLNELMAKSKASCPPLANP